MVFMKFNIVNFDDFLIFVGTSEEAILKDTQGGKSFGSFELKDYQIVSEEYARKEKPKYIEEGIMAVEKAITLRLNESFLL